MIKIIIVLVLMQSLVVQADVVHHIQFCAGQFCAATAPLSISQQLELNQQFEEGNLVATPTTHSLENDEQSKQSQLAGSYIQTTQQQQEYSN